MTLNTSYAAGGYNCLVNHNVYVLIPSLFDAEWLMLEDRLGDEDVGSETDCIQRCCEQPN